MACASARSACVTHVSSHVICACRRLCTRWGGASETVFSPRQHLDELATSGKESASACILFIRQRPGYGTDDVRRNGRNLRVEGIGLGPAPVALAKSRTCRGFGDHDRQPRREERPAEWQLETTGRFQDRSTQPESPQTLDHVGKPGLIIGYDETSLRVAGQYPIEPSRHRYQQTMGRCHGLLLGGPSLHDAGLWARANCSGSFRIKRCDPGYSRFSDDLGWIGLSARLEKRFHHRDHGIQDTRLRARLFAFGVSPGEWSGSSFTPLRCSC